SRAYARTIERANGAAYPSGVAVTGGDPWKRPLTSGARPRSACGFPISAPTRRWRITSASRPPSITSRLCGASSTFAMTRPRTTLRRPAPSFATEGSVAPPRQQQARVGHDDAASAEAATGGEDEEHPGKLHDGGSAR